MKDVRRLIEGRVLVNVPMKRFTSIKAGGPADGLFFPRDVDELRTLIRAARKRSIPTLILGKGTNLIVTGKGFRGWMISLTQGLNRFQIDETSQRPKPASSSRGWFAPPCAKGSPG